MKAVAHSQLTTRRHTWFEDEDDVDIDDDPAAGFHAPDARRTREIHLLGGLIGDPPVVLDEVTPIAEACRLLLAGRVSAVAVAGSDARLRGLVTRRDVLRLCAAGGSLATATVDEALPGPRRGPLGVFSLPADATVEAAAALMALEQVGHVVVTGRDGELVGIVSALDIARDVAVRAGYVVA